MDAMHTYSVPVWKALSISTFDLGTDPMLDIPPDIFMYNQDNSETSKINADYLISKIAIDSVMYGQDNDNGDEVSTDFITYDTHTIVYDGGHIFDITSNPSPVFVAQNDDHYHFGHPYHPWINANKYWITNIIFSQAQMSMSSQHTTINLKHHSLKTWQGDYDVWYHDPIKVIATLFGNPMFHKNMAYTAEQHMDIYNVWEYSEIHWSDWWHETQILALLSRGTSCWVQQLSPLSLELIRHI
ncbi:hypothetical protein BC938DRAFT_478384 [Jimgerdemannia flammicorona]|uniref:Uncharacterized protein n=1 Tax=Jimgerdemannia flammicorona TaxID=994334 RepID=A0A433QN17_9FUNG|nr:hypothetical protein BC938DRAFT_478384 [Jimgerdemannia flammicorona]